MLVWWPIIGRGIWRAYRLGRQQVRDGAPPTAFALLAWAAVTWAVVASYVPLAWDRYFMPIQAPNALLAAVGIAAFMDRWRRKAVSV